MRILSSEPIYEKNGVYFRAGIKMIKLTCSNCSQSTFRRVENKAGVYFCNDKCEEQFKDFKGSTIMDKINDPNFYYLVGIIAADGNLQRGAKGVSVCMSKKHQENVDLILKLKSYFGGRIEEYKDNCMYWKIYNKQFSDYLKDIGFSHNKTHNLNLTTWFNRLDTTDQWHFMRGLWDGDGTFFIKSYNNYTSYRSQFGTASKFMFDLVCAKLEDNYTTRIEQGKNGEFYKIKVSTGKQIISKFSNFYSLDTCIKLERKYNKFKDIEKYVNRRN
jgi:hypothetical protein